MGNCSTRGERTAAKPVKGCSCQHPTSTKVNDDGVPPLQSIHLQSTQVVSVLMIPPVLQEAVILTQGGNKSMFVGSASISLEFLLSEKGSKYLTLPLEFDAAIQIDPMCPPQLIVRIYNYSSRKGQPKPDDGRMDFVINVIQAKGIPKRFSESVHCKYIFKWGGNLYKLPDLKGSTGPDV
eukprot:TRINITY_DN1951_c0_g1_i2.p1 TRINITY_DN1951_c0_g1~~TRINITY_DN1951_c0_g1_i2.p1  ORF type:complete len:180 (+),score=27.63 TRINITY_DN1951_c0_g1_i2:60-599(+)